MVNVAIYGRFSSELQNPKSAEDQVRICTQEAEQRGWSVVKVYTDHAKTGKFTNRPGFQELRRDLAKGEFTIILTEALDRLSRDPEDTHALYKRAKFAGIKIITLSEGEITPMLLGFKGTMNAMMITDMSEKVKRDQSNQVVRGKIGGGNCYGYKVAHRVDEAGKVVFGERAIDAEQTEVIARIFREFAKGMSPRAIASGLNRDRIPGPKGKKQEEKEWREGKWQQSTIYGNWQRGSGILNNELYRGWIVWNKVSYPTDPDTGKPVARINPESQWVRTEVPQLRIIEEALWNATKERQKRTRTSHKKFWQHQRPVYLFSGLLKCGCCGGGFSKISTEHYGCSTVRNKGDSVCDNRRNIRQEELERTVLHALQHSLMDPALVDEFAKEYTRHINRLRDERGANAKSAKAEIGRLASRAKKIVNLAIDGFGTDSLKKELIANETRQRELEMLLAEEPESPVRLHPDLSQRYRREIKRLVRVFHEGRDRSEAVGLIRSLVEKIILTPDAESAGLLIDLQGDLAGILNLAQDQVATSESELKQIRLAVGLETVEKQRKRAAKHALGAAVASSTPQNRGKMVGPPDHLLSTSNPSHRQGKLVGPA